MLGDRGEIKEVLTLVVTKEQDRKASDAIDPGSLSAVLHRV